MYENNPHLFEPKKIDSKFLSGNGAHFYVRCLFLDEFKLLVRIKKAT